MLLSSAQYRSVGSRLPVNAQPSQLRRPSFLLNDPSPPLLHPLAFPEVTVTDTAIFVRDPSFLTTRH